jgi:integrase
MRHLRGDVVFSDAGGALWSRGEADTRLRRSYRKAGLRKFGWHTLRHTFCSALAMRGAPVRTIQELAGHASITTAMGYMHLTPTATRDAVALLEAPRPPIRPRRNRRPEVAAFTERMAEVHGNRTRRAAASTEPHRF